MKAKIFRIAILFIFSSSLLAENAIVLKQEGAPLRITEYSTQYGVYERRKVIAHSVKYINTTEKKIVAVKFGFVSFTVFNEFLNKFVGITVENIDLNQETKSMWTDNHPRAFLFENYGTGLAYIDAVRYEDGTIWKVNDADILPQIQEIESSFTADLLKEK